MNIRLNSKLISSLGSVLFMSSSDMMAAAGIASTTWYSIMQKPDGITIQQLLSIANGLHIPVRRFFGNSPISTGHRGDYIIEPYNPCRYDAEKLQEIVSTHTDKTWQRAAEATGMTRDNLRKSLLAVRRTPVLRFLSVCSSFNIDPFTILIDPNPKPGKKGTKRVAANLPADSQGKPVNVNIYDEIIAIRNDIRHLSSTIDDLTKKYEKLLVDHKSIFKRLNKHIIENHNNIETVPDDK